MLLLFFFSFLFFSHAPPLFKSTARLFHAVFWLDCCEAEGLVTDRLILPNQSEPWGAGEKRADEWGAGREEEEEEELEETAWGSACSGPYQLPSCSASNCDTVTGAGHLSRLRKYTVVKVGRGWAAEAWEETQKQTEVKNCICKKHNGGGLRLMWSALIQNMNGLSVSWDTEGCCIHQHVFRWTREWDRPLTSVALCFQPKQLQTV